MKLKLLLMLLLIPVLFSNVSAHTMDSIDHKYRIEIGWMNEPVVTGETNGIELYVSSLIPSCPESYDSFECAESQEFQNGVTGLEKTLKMELVYDTEKITIRLAPDHNISGKYYAFVDPTVAGYYQANIVGTIEETPVSLSMHPPKVDERSYIEFPEPSDATLNEIIDAHTGMVKDINDLKESITNTKQTQSQDSLGYAGIGLGIVAIAIAGAALAKSKK